MQRKLESVPVVVYLYWKCKWKVKALLGRWIFCVSLLLIAVFYSINQYFVRLGAIDYICLAAEGKVTENLILLVFNHNMR